MNKARLNKRHPSEEVNGRDHKKKKLIERKPAALMSLMVLTIAVASATPIFLEESPISERVSSILIYFPAQSSSEKTALAAEIVKLGEPGIVEVCRRLSPPGKADDSLARYALEAAGTYAMRPGGEKDRNLYTQSIIKALKSAADPDVKIFLIGRLQQRNRMLPPLLMWRKAVSRKQSDPQVVLTRDLASYAILGGRFCVPTPNN